MGEDTGGSAHAAANHSSQRQENIDLLRAIAILAVIAYHFSTNQPLSYYRTDAVPFTFPIGRLGVDMFFGVSAFCIFMTLESSHRLERFWAKRLSRIQPAYMVAVVLTFAMVALFGLPGRETSLGDAVANLFWGTVLPGVDLVDGAYWSLIVELKFYFLIGPLYFLMRGRQISSAWACLCVLGWLMIISPHFIGTPGKYVAKGAEVLLIAEHSPQFLVGLLAYEWRRLPIWNIVAVAFVIIVTTATSDRYAGQELDALLVLAFTFAVLQLRELRVPRPLIFIGLISYPLYLVHQNIGLIVIRGLAEALPGMLPRQLIAFLVVLLIAAAIHYSVESRWQRPLTKKIEETLARVFRLGQILRPRVVSDKSGSP